MSENCGVFVDEVYSWTLNHERTRLPRFRNQVQLLPLQAMRQRPQAKQRGIWVEPLESPEYSDQRRPVKQDGASLTSV